MDDEFIFDELSAFHRDVVAAGGFAGVGSHGQLQGLGYHWELWLMQAGGLSEHDALKVATIYGANGIGLESEVGSLEPGKLADIVVLDRNPLDDIRNTDSVRWVIDERSAVRRREPVGGVPRPADSRLQGIRRGCSAAEIGPLRVLPMQGQA